MTPALVPGNEGAAFAVVIRKREEAERDEMWSVVGRKKPPRWLWEALDHQTGRIVADVFGRREDHAFLTIKAPLTPFGMRRFSPTAGARIADMWSHASIEAASGGPNGWNAHI